MYGLYEFRRQFIAECGSGFSDTPPRLRTHAVRSGPDVGVVAQTVTRTLLNVSEIKDGVGNV